MSKIKLSFSLILAIFLVGILSTAAFAKDPYGLKPVQNGLGLDVPFTGNSADATDIAGRSFDVVLLDGSTIVSTTAATLDASKKGKVSYAAGILTPGKTYTVELYHTDDATHATKLSTSTALVQDAHNTNMYQTPDSHVDLDGSGLKNANSTGFNNTRKNRSGQKVHGFYQNNTNSCASCHQTHTGSDNNLLFKEGTYSTCSACHDGTTGAYNSFAPVSEENAHSIAGTFNVQTANHNGSLHTADGSLKVSAAPGGNNNAAVGSTFDQEFDCASCHAPHGNGSAGASGENNLNLDPLGWGSVQYRAEGTTYTVKVNNVDTTVTATKDDANGKLFKDLTINTSVPTTFSTPYILVKSTLADQAAVDANFFYKRAMGTVTGPVDVIQTYRWNNTKYVPDYSLWLQEKGYPYKADTKLMNGTTDITRATGMTVVWRDGFAYGTQVANVTTATISVGVDVETTNDIATLFDNKNLGFIPDSGTQMSKYCSACHTDYLSTTRKDVTGVYTTAHRHKTGADELTCVRCHFGHGSEAQIMKTANDQTYYDLIKAGQKFDSTVTDQTAAAIDYLKDPNPSSALKRYTGMAVCYACHGQGAQFLSNPNNVDRPLTGQPGAVRGQ